jgi:hypothetical protein
VSADFAQCFVGQGNEAQNLDIPARGNCGGLCCCRKWGPSNNSESSSALPQKQISSVEEVSTGQSWVQHASFRLHNSTEGGSEGRDPS